MYINKGQGTLSHLLSINLLPENFQLCRPSVNCTSPEWQHRYIQYHEYTCTGTQTDKFKDMRMSFLSGHSSWSAYTMVFLAVSFLKALSVNNDFQYNNNSITGKKYQLRQDNYEK